MSNKFQNEDFKTEAELVSAGGTKAQLLNDTKIYVTANGIAKTLDQAILDGDIGGSGGVGGVDIMATDTADKASLGQYTQVGLEILTSPVILHGTKSFRLIHQAASTRYFTKIIPVDRKFRGKLMTIEIDVVSTALSANLTLLVKNETNPGTPIDVAQQVTTGSQTITATVTSTSLSMTGLSASDFSKLKLGQVITGTGIQSGTTITGLQPATLSATLSLTATSTSTSTKTISALTTKRTFGFLMPEDCLSFSYTISALQEAGAPESYIDDIVIQLLASAMSSTTVTVPKNNDFSGQITNGITVGAITTAPTKGTVVVDKITSSRFGNRLVANYQYQQGAVGTAGIGDYIFSLPVGLSFDLSQITPYTGSLFSTNSANVRATVGTSTATVGIEQAIGKLIAYSATQFRVINLFASSAGGAVNGNSMSPSSFSFSNANMSFSFDLDAPIQNWLANETETKTIPLTTSVIYQEQDSMLLATGFVAAFGSTATKYLTFGDLSSFIRTNVGDAIQITRDAVNGDKIKALKAGNYNFSFKHNNNGTVSGETGVTTDLVSTTVIANVSSKVVTGFTINGDIISLDGKAYLEKDQEVRLFSNANSLTAGTFNLLSISYEGSLKILNPSKDQKIDIPTHELRFEGASSRGATDTAVVKFDTLANIRGDAFSVVNTAANGTVVTMKKAGTLVVSGSLNLNSGFYRLTKNQAVLTAMTTTLSEILTQVGAGTNSWNYSIPVDVKVGDKIRLTGSANPIADIGNSLTLSLQENSVQVALSNVLPQFTQSDSAVRVTAGNGFGSTNLQVRRFSNLIDNIGPDVTYSDSATLGASFLINSDGLYDMSYTEASSGSGTYSAYITLNSPVAASGTLTLSRGSVNGADYSTSSIQKYLLKGDIIRAVVPAVSAVNATDMNVQFSISKVGKPNLTSVDVTPFVNIKTQDTQAIEALTANSTWGSTNTGVAVLNITKNTNKGILQVSSDSVNGTSFIALKDCNITISGTVQSNVNGGAFYVTRNETVLTAAPPTNAVGHSITFNGAPVEVLSANASLLAGDIIRIQRDSTGTFTIRPGSLMITATAASDTVATQTQVVSSDTMNLVWKAGAIVDSDPIGTFNTLVYTTTSNTANLAPTAPTQTPASMNINGIQLFARPYGSPGSAATPARFDIKVGSGLKGKDIFGFAGLARTLPVRTAKVQPSTTEAQGMEVTYDDKRGILSIDAGFNGGGVTSAFFKGAQGTNDINYASAYIIFNIGTAPNLVAIPALQSRIAYIKDVKASGIPGGSCVAGLQTRTLNDLVNNSGLGISLNANQIIFTELGTFRITGNVPAFFCSQNKAYLFNVTDGIAPASLVGSSTYSGAGTADATQSLSYIDGEITITKTTVFELRHYTQIARSPNGLGVVSISGGQIEIYSSLAIQKIK